jgi:hypothetical protein
MPKFLTPHFTLEEMIFSQTAERSNIANKPGAAEIAALQALCQNVLEPLRTRLDKPIVVSSGYRSPPLNRAVGGADASQHQFGQAADILCPPITVKRLFKRVLELGLPFDQLIYEGGRRSQWVHVSYVSPQKNRGEILDAEFPLDGPVKYTRVTRAAALAR